MKLKNKTDEIEKVEENKDHKRDKEITKIKQRITHRELGHVKMRTEQEN